jgi:hypothetical protein
MSTGGDPRPERASCISCAHRGRCHGRKPIVTRDTILQLVREAVVEVLTEASHCAPEARGFSCVDGRPAQTG